MTDTVSPRPPQVSVVMPAYNAGHYIGESIRSILNQSFSDFELIICDDCSTDDTAAIVREFSDKRIRLLSTPRNTGSAKYPRELAIEASRAPLVCWIDSDDTVEQDYLLKLLARRESTGADIVCSRMIALRDGARQYTLPADGFDYSRVMDGREAVLLSLDFPWQINFNGWLCSRRQWMTISTFKSLEINHMDADDYSAREIVYNAPKVAFANAEYYYRLHPDAITKKIGLKKFESVITDRLVLEYFRSQGFAAGTKAMSRAVCLRMISLMRLWCIHNSNMPADESSRSRRLLQQYFKLITNEEVNLAHLDSKQLLLIKLPFFLSILTIAGINRNQIREHINKNMNANILNTNEIQSEGGGIFETRQAA